MLEPSGARALAVMVGVLMLGFAFAVFDDAGGDAERTVLAVPATVAVIAALAGGGHRAGSIVYWLSVAAWVVLAVVSFVGV